MTDGGKYCQNIFQSTLLQEERLSSIKMEKSHIISIHAPTRGATDKAVEGILNILNFNPRSYKRSDINRHTRCLWRINFNPRSYKRSDVTGCADYHANTKFQSTLLQEERRSLSGARNRNEYISLHAPTKGAATSGRISHNLHIHFNPRSYKRSDYNPCHNCTEVIISIHAPTRGATWCYFFVLKFSKISIHAPTRGATGLHPLFISVMRISIHAPTRGATTSDNDKLDESEISIHAPTRGATTLPDFAVVTYKISIHAPTRGATLITCIMDASISYFNPRSYKRSDV